MGLQRFTIASIAVAAMLATRVCAAQADMRGVFRTFIPIIALLLILFAVSYIIFKLINPPQKNQLVKIRKQIANILNIPLKDIMTERLITVNESTTAHEIISIFDTNNAGSILVTDGKKLKGIITETDILRKIEDKRLSAITAGDIMTRNVTSANKAMRLGEAELLMIKHKIRKLPIVEQENLIGIVTMTDILKSHHDFFNKHAFESEHIPLVESYLSKDYIRAQANDRIKDHLSQFIKWKSNAILGMQKTKLLGIITERDLLMAYTKNPRFLTAATVKTLMKTNLITIPKNTSIIKANNISIDKDIRRLIVVEGDEVAGFITQVEILDAFCTFLAFITSDEGKKAISTADN
jgi:CBS domain-containing protein